VGSRMNSAPPRPAILKTHTGLENVLQAHPGEVAPYKLLPEVVGAVGEVVKKRLRLFNFR
jgi:hypothetical protein